MIDTRNSYRAIPLRHEGDAWWIQYRCWWSPFWKGIGYAVGIDRAHDKAVEHSKPDKRKNVHFGRLPE